VKVLVYVDNWPLIKLVPVVVPVLVVEYVLLVIALTPLKVMVAVVLLTVWNELICPFGRVVVVEKVVGPVDVDVRRPLKPVLNCKPLGYELKPTLLKPNPVDVVKNVCVGPLFGNVVVVKNTEVY